MPVTGDPILSDPTWELQKDEFSLLGADGTLTAAGWSIYDFPPTAKVFPYIVVGDDTGAPDYNKSGAVHNVVSTFHLFSEYRGRKEVKLGRGALIAALTGGSFSFAGFTLIQVSLDDLGPILREFDGDRVLHHGITRIRYLIN